MKKKFATRCTSKLNSHYFFGAIQATFLLILLISAAVSPIWAGTSGVTNERLGIQVIDGYFIDVFGSTRAIDPGSIFTSEMYGKSICVV